MKIFVVVKITDLGYGAEEKTLLTAYKDEMAADKAVEKLARNSHVYNDSYDVEEIELF